MCRRRPRSRGAARPEAEAALRRPETARGDGPGIIRQPQVFLMDEPLSNLDAQLRCTCAARSRPTEAARRDDGLRHPRPGGSDDDGRPRRDPARRRAPAGGHADERLRPAANLFVAGFIGSPPMNLARGTIEPEGGGGLVVRLGARRSRFPAVFPRPRASRSGSAASSSSASAPRTSEDRRRMAGLKTVPPWRPRSTASRRSALSSSASTPSTRRRRRAEAIAEATGGGLEEVALITREAPFCATFEPRSAIYAGDTVEVTVDVRHLHFFQSRDRAGHRNVEPSLRSLPAGRARAG